MSEVQKIMSWKAPEDKPAESQQPPVEANPALVQEKPKKQRKPSAPKPKGKKKGRLDVMLGWFLETVPVYDKEDGTLGSDISKRTIEPVKGAKGVGDLMKYFRNKAATDPDSVTGRAIRFVKVEKVFVAKTRTIVDIEE